MFCDPIIPKLFENHEELTVTIFKSSRTKKQYSIHPLTIAIQSNV